MKMKEVENIGRGEGANKIDCISEERNFEDRVRDGEGR